MTQLESARKNIITEEMKHVAAEEGLDVELIRERVAEGTIVINKNKNHKTIKGLGVGLGLRTKVNANIGTSQDKQSLDMEIEKLKVAIDAGADAIMDLSTGGDIDRVRKVLIEESSVVVGTVPVYQAIMDTKNQGKAVFDLDPELLFDTIEKHGEDGVDFITVHSGVTLESVKQLRKQGRIMGIVSRGGALTAEWMAYNKKENPLYAQFDRLIAIAKKYDMVLSLGDGLRPGCLNDATDRGQISELIKLGELTKAATDAGVQVMIEGPGHMPINQIEANMLLQKKLCHNAPFYVLGPLVTDIAPGYDHITSAIGGAIAASSGADFLCYVTPAEHLRLPDAQDVKDGVIATRIAAHAGDIAKGVKGAIEKDNALSRARKSMVWEDQFALAMDPQKARDMRGSSLPEDDDVCTMCGSLCSIKTNVQIDKNLESEEKAV